MPILINAPVEVALLVFQYLDNQTLKAVSQTCTYCFDVINSFIATPYGNLIRLTHHLYKKQSSFNNDIKDFLTTTNLSAISTTKEALLHPILPKRSAHPGKRFGSAIALFFLFLVYTVLFGWHSLCDVCYILQCFLATQALTNFEMDNIDSHCSSIRLKRYTLDAVVGFVLPLLFLLFIKTLNEQSGNRFIATSDRQDLGTIAQNNVYFTPILLNIISLVTSNNNATFKQMREAINKDTAQIDNFIENVKSYVQELRFKKTSLVNAANFPTREHRDIFQYCLWQWNNECDKKYKIPTITREQQEKQLSSLLST